MDRTFEMKYFTIFIFLLQFHEFTGQEISERIFGGSEASEDAFPWMVSVRFYDKQQTQRIYDICGGSIVSELFVLTAASCFFNVHTLLTNQFSIKAGIHNIINGSEDTEQIHSISNIIVHPNYNSFNLLNDLALVHVSPAFNFTRMNLEAIFLSNLMSVEDVDLVAIGWGVLNQSNPTVAAAFLQQITVHEDVACSKNKTINSTTQLCATGKNCLLNYNT